MFGLGLSTGELMERGVTLGADIPYCLMRGTALSEGIGERLSPLPPMPQCQVLIAKPGISVSTKVVYESLDAMKLAPSDHPDIDGMIDAIRSQNLREWQAGSGMCWSWSPENGIRLFQGLNRSCVTMGLWGQ